MSSSKGTYKKRVISESEDDDDDDAPLMQRTTSNHSNPEAVANGGAILKEAGNHEVPDTSKLGLEDAHLRQEIAAAGFPVGVTNAVSSTGAHADHPMADAKAVKKEEDDDESKMDVDKKDESSSSDDDKPLAAKTTNGKNGKASSSNNKRKSRSSTASSSKATSSKDEDEDGNASSSSTSDDDAPLAAKVNGKAKPAVKKEEASSDEDDDVPLAAKAKPKKAAAKGKKRAKKDDSDDDEAYESEDAKPAKKKTKTAAASKGKAKKVKKEDSVDEGAGTSAKGKKGKQKVKNENEDIKDGIKDEDDESEEYKWWAEQNADGEEGPKWKTLEHNGVLFPPEYTPLPKNVKLLYNGKPVDLPPESEEVAGFYAAMLETDHAKDSIFQANFFKGFLETLAEYPPRNKITIGKNDFDKLDFRPMYDHFELEREKKKAMTKAEKAEAKKEKDAIEKGFITCLVDGRVEKVGNFRLEPPGLFRGRGEHPKKGTLKLRLQAEDITINIGKEAKVPEPPAGHKWAKVQHDPNVTWLATWKENINGGTKYVFLAAGSAWKGQSDLKKFEKARKLKDMITTIRQDYEADLTSKVMADRQRATAVYFIDRFALRVGNEKGEDEADTVGCCSLRYEHVTLKEPNLVTFDFLGKDSIRFYQPDKEVTTQVFKNLKLFKKGSEEGADLFDRISPTILNKFFSSYMKGLSAKVFRTYNASILLQQQLASTPKDASVADKMLHYNRANRLVAELCNHQRAAAKGHGAAMEKLADKVKAIKYQRMKLRYTLWAVDSDNKKQYKQYKEMESDLDDDWCEAHEKDLMEKEKAKIKKKWEKDNEKKKAEGEKESTEKELEKLLEEVDGLDQELKEEREKKHVEPKSSQTTAKIITALGKIDDRIDAAKVQAVDKEEGKEVSLTTSKINYMDPRITIAFSKKFGVPLEKIFSATLRKKFVWAMDVPEDWEF